MAFWRPNGLFLGRDNFQKMFELLFFVLPSIITFVSDLIFGSLWAFLTQNGYFGSQGNVQKQFLDLLM